ncbi:MAG TPA: sulfotransferase [Candidatus Binatia bacterium]|nr:sulfotransferase [Candidatus Binatia bacterium]
MSSRLILILSSERSGSTLTRVILGAHSRIVAPQEMFLMRYPDYEAFRTQKSVAVESMVELFDLLGKPMDTAAIDAACRGMTIHEVYRWMFAALAPEQILLDKTPAYANDGDTLRRSVALDPTYIWLVRHPLAVIESHVRLKHREHHSPTARGWARWARDGVVESFESYSGGLSPLARQREIKWVVQQTIIREFLASVPDTRKCTIRFEDLVTDPEPQVNRLCQAIGLDLEPTMLEACGARKVMNVHLGDPNFHTHDRIDPATASIWRQHFSEDQLTLETRRLMDAIGVAR